ncbi:MULTISPECIES: hypothetical protein [unclassified Frankia]|uniref:hypothetical protein n=1 Tax=unclassified Frankia TaxID=2632575 RepID=UPI002AD4C862|nr:MULTISPECIES: hypothetical protein [unclassified Frankia]
MAVLVFHIVRRPMKGRIPFPMIMLVPVVTQYIWFMAAPPGYYFAVIPFFHSMQYLFIAWNVHLKESIDSTGRKPSVNFAVSESARWVGVNVALAFFLFWIIPRLGSQFGQSLAFSTAVIFVALQIHHFFVDGVIWKLRNPKTAAPLSSSPPEVIGDNPLAAADVDGQAVARVVQLDSLCVAAVGKHERVSGSDASREPTSSWRARCANDIVWRHQ